MHSIRVMAVIEKMLHRLDDPRRSALVRSNVHINLKGIDKPDNLFQILVDYGRRHFGYGVKEIMLEFMAESFILAIQPSLEES